MSTRTRILLLPLATGLGCYLVYQQWEEQVVRAPARSLIYLIDDR